MDYEICFKPDVGPEKFVPAVLSNAHAFCALAHKDAGEFNFLIRRFELRTTKYHGSAWGPGACVTVHYADLLGNQEAYERNFNAYDFEKPEEIATRIAQDLSAFLPKFFRRTWPEVEKEYAKYARLKA